LTIGHLKTYALSDKGHWLCIFFAFWAGCLRASEGRIFVSY